MHARALLKEFFSGDHVGLPEKNPTFKDQAYSLALIKIISLVLISPLTILVTENDSFRNLCQNTQLGNCSNIFSGPINTLMMAD